MNQVRGTVTGVGAFTQKSANRPEERNRKMRSSGTVQVQKALQKHQRKARNVICSRPEIANAH